MDTITKADLTDLIANRSGITRSQAAAVVDCVLESIVGALIAGDKVELRGFGSFRTRDRGARKGRNPRTGEKVQVPAKRVPYFKPGKALQEHLASVVD